MFAVSEIDPRVGTIEVNYSKRSKGRNNSKTPIQLVQCEELLPGGKHEGESNNELFDLE